MKNMYILKSLEDNFSHRDRSSEYILDSKTNKSILRCFVEYCVENLFGILAEYCNVMLGFFLTSAETLKSVLKISRITTNQLKYY